MKAIVSSGTAPIQFNRICTILTATCMLAMSARADEVRLRFVSSGAANAVGFPPQNMALSETRPVGLTSLPAGLAAPLYGVLKLGAQESPTSFIIVVDEPEGKPARLFVDANGNGDLTDDAEAEWRPKTVTNARGQEVVTYSGGATLKVPYGSGPLDIHIGMYRNDKNDPERSRLRNSLFYYRDYGYVGEVVLGGRSFQAFLSEDQVTGDFRGRFVFLAVDLNRNGKFDSKGEFFGVGAGAGIPIGSTDYGITVLTASGDALEISVLEKKPLPKLVMTEADIDLYAENLSVLIGALRSREYAVNELVLACLTQLAEAQRVGWEPGEVAGRALAQISMGDELNRLTVEALVRHLRTAEALGCLDPESLALMRQGKPPTVRRGPNRGDLLDVDRIIPWQVCGHLDNVLANMELVPRSMVQVGWSGKVSRPQIDLAVKLDKAGIMLARDLREIEDLAAQSQETRTLP